MLLQKLKSIFSKKEDPRLAKKGILKYFNHSRGYGFIKSRDVKKDVFVHISEMENSVKVGDEVKFEVEQVPKGLTAKNVELAEA